MFFVDDIRWSTKWVTDMEREVQANDSLPYYTERFIAQSGTTQRAFSTLIQRWIDVEISTVVEKALKNVRIFRRRNLPLGMDKTKTEMFQLCYNVLYAKLEFYDSFIHYVHGENITKW